MTSKSITRHSWLDGGKLREHFDACVKQHLMTTHCDTAVASASLERLTKCVTMAAQETLCVKKHQTLRKRCVSNRTRQLHEQRRRDCAKLSEDEQRVAKRANAHHVEKITESTSMGYSMIWTLLNVVATVGKCPG